MSHKPYWNEKIETLSREELEKYQTVQLKKHLKFAYENSQYYNKSFDRAGVKYEDFKSLADIRKFPFINKKIQRDCQAERPLLGSLTAVAEKEVVFVSASSGSTGLPTLSPFTNTDFKEFQDVESRLFWSIGMRPTDRYVHALNFSLFVGGPTVIGAQELGALCIWAGAIPSERLLYILKEFQPTIIWTTPSYAWYLGETAIKQGINPASDLAINKIIVAGEPGGSIGATRRAIENLWDAEVYDFYGISDIFGACAGMCQERKGLHLAEDHLLMEVIDPKTLEVLPDGQRGELVLTTLRKKARPMIRFRTGDIVISNKEKCACGRSHARIEVVGRLDDMFIVSGVNVFPSDIEFIVRNIKELNGEYRIYAIAENFTTKFKLEVEKRSNIKISNEDLAKKVSRNIKTRLGLSPKEVTILKEGELPRAVHKSKRFIDLR